MEKNSGNVKRFHGRFSVLKRLNFSHRHSTESTVHQDLAIEVIIPENCFIMVHCGLVHCGTPSWFICNGEFSSNTR